jgi:hypothetical protein
MSDETPIKLTTEEKSLLAWALGLATADFLRVGTEQSKKSAEKCIALHNKIQAADPDSL